MKSDLAFTALRRAGVRILVCALVLALVGLVGLVTAQTVSWFMGGAGLFGGDRCGVVGDDSLLATGGAAGATDEQRINASVIVGVGLRMQVPERGQWVALATAMQESGLRNIAYGDRDSLGLFQQRPSQGWGSPAQVMDPSYAATQFYSRLLAVPGWVEMPLWKAAQTVQRSAFPTAYSKWEQAAAKLLAEVGDDVSLATTDVCMPRGGTGGPAAVPYGGPPTGCALDDPTTAGCLTGATRHALDEVSRVFGGYRAGALLQATSCWDQHAWNPSSDHPRGRACDFFPGTAGRFAAGDDLEAGWQIAEWFRANADALRVSYVIWQGRIWTAGGHDTPSGWGRPYGGGGIYDPHEATGGHFDHLHVSFTQ
ncbi:hypothetical protein [Pseudonocardia sp. TRM90224]|uniref:hypothetical protein n=1 Tax=Pseudonocardia sp. TRM90224 TaxID=2812678 RepID=UPI001E56BABD|nr:hypothetical protein [Pseudonocardia sp. TRM90224]